MDCATEYYICLCLKGTSVSQFNANVCLQLVIIIIVVNTIILMQCSCLYETMICYSTYYNSLLLLSCTINMLWSRQPSINDIVTSFTKLIAMFVNYCRTIYICNCRDTVCMYALWNPPINKLMNNYICLKHYTCTCK